MKARRVLRAVLHRMFRESLGIPSSDRYELLPDGGSPDLSRGWQDPLIPDQQWAAIAPLLAAMRAGKPRQDFVALADAVRMTGLQDPVVIEVGCGSGWNAEVLAQLLGHPFTYIGLDYSYALVRHGRTHYPNLTFVVGDAASLPLQDDVCDILIAGTVLMHVPQYELAIRESRRVCRQWCVFHSVPVTKVRPTTFLRKLAYGVPVVEVIFNENELLELFTRNCLRLEMTLRSVPYDLSEVLGEATESRTYVCRAE